MVAPKYVDILDKIHHLSHLNIFYVTNSNTIHKSETSRKISNTMDIMDPYRYYGFKAIRPRKSL